MLPPEFNACLLRGCGGGCKAHLPAVSPAAACRAPRMQYRIPPPDVHVVPGAEVEVTWRLPQELDVPGEPCQASSSQAGSASTALPSAIHSQHPPLTRSSSPLLPAGALQELRRHLRSPAFTSREEGSWGSTVSESVSSGAEGRATHLVRRSRGACLLPWAPAAADARFFKTCMLLQRAAADCRVSLTASGPRPPLAAGLGALSVLVMQPHDQQLPARLCFRGSASERDLALMSAALQAAMAPRRRRGALEVRAVRGGCMPAWREERVPTKPGCPPLQHKQLLQACPTPPHTQHSLLNLCRSSRSWAACLTGAPAGAVGPLGGRWRALWTPFLST